MEAYGISNLAKFIRTLLEQYLPDKFFVDLAMSVVGIAGIFAVMLTLVALLVWVERKVSAFMQMRLGPNRLGPFGIFQTVADMLKLLTKEDIRPEGVDKKTWALAPIILFIPSAAVYAVLPFDNGAIFTDVNIGLFYFIAISSQVTLPFLMAGWASDNKYSLIGGMRTVAQMISYEIPLVFSLLGVVMIVGSMQMSDIVTAQKNVWFICLQPIAFIIYVIAATAETNRTPFDLVEAESEIVAGPFTEYSGMRWALFFLAEYANLVAVSAIATTLFLGGWNGPWLPGWVWFGLKTAAMIFVFMWFRWTFPRLRVDQLMAFGWKVLLPLALVNIVVTGIGVYVYNLIA
jgi:NADH-quinone oxidoreductase subunit H